jgi:assimilatory nitrate reductase catalytic subunit
MGIDERLNVAGNPGFPTNKGALCVKGWTSAELLRHPERLTLPLARNARGKLLPVSWDEALQRIARRFTEVQIKYGRDAAGLFGSGALTNEKTYLLGKFARVALGTANIDYNGRFCMSSAAAASNKAFGVDRGLPFPLDDIAHTEVILMVGSNSAETMPPLMQYFEQQRKRGGKLIVIDPRQSLTANQATLHLKLTPGSDAALANGLLHILIRDGLIDSDYIQTRTTDFARVKGLVAAYWPAQVERITGVPEAQLVQAAHLFGNAKSAMILTGRGAEQQSQGVNNVLSFINLALATGRVGRPFSGYGCLTGQGNGQGGREHGQKADQLPGYRKIDDTAARAYIAEIWGVNENEIPRAGKSAYELLSALGSEIKALLVMGSNIVVSAPNATRIRSRVRNLEFLAVADFFLSETAQLADVVLPAAQWAEEEGTMTNLEGRVLLRQRAVAPPAGVKTDLEILCELGKRLGRREQFAYESPREVFDELRLATKGALADYSGITYEKIAAQQGVFWPCNEAQPNGTPRMFAEKFATPDGRARFHAVRHQSPAEEPDAYYPFYLTTGRVLSHYQSGTQTRRVNKLVEMNPEPFAEIHPTTAKRFGIVNGAVVWLQTRRDAAQFKVKITPTIREDTVFVPFHWGGAQAVNRLTNAALDPTSRMPEFKVCAVRIQSNIDS